jgi:hypothetical protein
MNARKRYFLVLAPLLLASCNGLPRSLRNDFASEKDRLQQAQTQLQHSQQTVRDDLAHSPDLFKGASVATEWPARLQSAQTTLDRAKDDLQQVDKLTRADEKRAEQLVRDARSLRESVLRESEGIEEEATKWLDFERNVPHYLTVMQSEYDQIHGADLTPLAKTVEKAEQDWPAKKGTLDTRLAALRQSAETAEMQWHETEPARQDAAAGKATGPEIATLIQANNALATDAGKLTQGAEELRAQCGQLYDAWDKILADLDISHRGGEPVYREKVKTVRTHFVDVAEKKTEVSSDESWDDVSSSAYRRVENDLGMAIAHKDAGEFDSEAQTTAQPAGFAYIAPPSQGSNQYGYWTHSGGESFWTFLPEYLVMRELLWGHSYRPVVINEYNGYQTAQRYGRSYYGQETPASPPKYGSHGTFTAERYAGSRYVQSGGFKGSAYASNRSSGPSEVPGVPRTEPHESSAGKRFGGNSNGQRFGGSHIAPRVPGRSFGRRR